MKIKAFNKKGNSYERFCKCCRYWKLGRFRHNKVHYKNWTSDY